MMIFPIILIAMFLQFFTPERVSSIDVVSILDPIDVMCIAVDLIPVFTQYDKSKVEFLLWTRSNPEDDEYHILEPFSSTSLEQFNGTRKTYVFIHGYTNVGTKKWILQAKTKILNLEDANIISLNFWELVARTTSDFDYAPAVCNCYKVGNYSAHVFNWLNENSELSASRMHLIGHSLGAHTAGVMAHYMIDLPIGKVSRITGLDPAGVLFSSKFINGFRLNKDQAHFVDIIHTNGCNIPAIVCFGISEKIGHIDFFPNGGIIQPGCNITNFANCSHERAPDLYVESIPPLNIEFQSWPCGSYFGYIFNFCESCGQGCVNMGFQVPTDIQGTYYLSTNGEPPFAKGSNQ